MSAIGVTNIPLSTTTPAPETSLHEYFKERRPEVQHLDDPPKSGNLVGAQQASTTSWH
jgi:hypothetical protein